jgi:hypothetical protein
MEVIHNPSQSRFEVDLGGAVAVLDYLIAGTTITFYHTEVPSAFEGQGIAGKMAREALEYARRSGFSVIPSCSFIARYIERHSEYKNLLENL